MNLTTLELMNFRNYKNAYIEFGSGKNFLIGKNAQGKSNLLEAIYLLCLSKSFRTNHEKEAIRFSEQLFILKGGFHLDNGNAQQVIFQCSHDRGKEIAINRKRLKSASELVGNFPVVLSSPDEYNLTLGPPPERRKFVDILLSQIYKKYFSYLREYHRIVKQRNAILLNWKKNYEKAGTLIEPWNQRLVETGSNIIAYRARFTAIFSNLLRDIYSRLIRNQEELTFDYSPNIHFEHLDEIKNQFQAKISRTMNQEIQRGTSLLGPHRDDFIFKINGRALRKYGSRGQHKTVLIALAISQFNLMKEKIQETPILLIDDLYSEIDEDREEKILSHLNDMGQVFITTTTGHPKKQSNRNDRYYYVMEGNVKSESDLVV